MLPRNGQPVPPIAVAPSESSAVVDCALYVDGVRQPGRRDYREAYQQAREHQNGFLWIGLREPGPEEFADIADTFDLHELAVEDAVKASQRPKVERYGEMTFVAMRTARYVEHAELTATTEVVEIGHVMFFVGPQFVITVRHGDAVNLKPVRAQLEDKQDLLEHGPWAVFHAVADRVVDVYLDVVGAMEEDIDDVEESVFSRHGGADVRRIYQLKRELVEFKRAVFPLQRPLTALVEGQIPGVPQELRRYIRDIADHLLRVTEQAAAFDDLLNSILQARLAQMSVEQNNDMRKIAAWAAIAAVQTTIAGVYGMNFRHMPELHWTYGYPLVIGVMVITAVVLHRAFRRSGWL